MSFLTVDDGTHLAYQVDGPLDGPTVVFSNSLGTSLQMWDAQVPALAGRFRVVRYDSRGHGRSDAPAGPYSVERLGLDLLGVLDWLDAERAHVCGLSLGGLVAQWLAIHHPARVDRLVLANTAAKVGTAEMWDARIAAVRAGGMGAVRDAVLERFLSEPFRREHPDETRAVAAMLEATNPEGYVGSCGALRDADLRPDLGRIGAPCLVVTGALDRATPPEQAADLSAAIPGSRLVVIPDVAHLSNVERPDLFNRHLLAHLTGQPAGAPDGLT